MNIWLAFFQYFSSCRHTRVFNIKISISIFWYLFCRVILKLWFADNLTELRCWKKYMLLLGWMHCYQKNKLRASSRTSWSLRYIDFSNGSSPFCVFALLSRRECTLVGQIYIHIHFICYIFLENIYIYIYIQRLKNQSTINLTGCWIVTV